MSTSLGFSTFSDMEETRTPALTKKKERFRNKTIKKRNRKVENFLNSMGKARTESTARADTAKEEEDNRPDEYLLDKSEIGEPYVNPNYQPAAENAGRAKTTGNLTAPTYDEKELEGFGLLKKGLINSKNIIIISNSITINMCQLIPGQQITFHTIHNCLIVKIYLVQKMI